MGRKDLVLGSGQEEGSDHRQVFGRCLLGIEEGFEEFIVVTPAGCEVWRTFKRRPREDAADPVFFNSIRGTPRSLLPDDEPREPREPREQPLRIDVRPVHTDLPPPINTELAKPRRVYVRISVEVARYGCTPGCIGCEAAMTQGTVSGGRWSRRTGTAPRSLRFVEAGAESERRSHCGDLQPTQDSRHAKSYGPDTWIALRHVTKLPGPGCSGER